MAEYIEREAVVRAFCEHCRDYVDKCTYDGACEVNIIAEIPTADVKPVKRGRWESEHYNELMECYEATCSECGYESTDKYHITDSHRFCENCGADMTGGTDND